MHDPNAVGATRTTAEEGPAVLAEIQAAAPSAPTACASWTAHDLVAHLAAGANEIADLVEDKLEGRPARPTRGFEEREEPFRALDHDALVGRLVDASKRKLRAYAVLLEHDDPTVEFTGTSITAGQLDVHSRSEAAIHRWDLVGDDDVSERLLGQPELTRHATWVLGAMPGLQESTRAEADRAVAAGQPVSRIVFRSPEQPDVVLVMNPFTPRFELVDEERSPDVVLTMPAHHRLLVRWGRRPATLRMRVDGDRALTHVLDDVLWPHAKAWA